MSESSMSVVDIKLPSLDILGFELDPLVPGYSLMTKVEGLLFGSARTNQMHLVRTLTPKGHCMAWSLYNGPGQEKIFEIFVSGDFYLNEVLFMVHRDYCPALYTFLGVEPSAPYAKILFRELVPYEDEEPEFFFCNWVASEASKDMASISFSADRTPDLLHFGALLVAIVKVIMDMCDKPGSESESSDSSEDFSEPGFKFTVLSSAKH